VADKVHGFIDRFVPGPVRKLLGLESPSKLFAQFGRDTVEGFAVGFGQRARELNGQLTLPLPVSAGLANTQTGGSQREAGGGYTRLHPDDLAQLGFLLNDRPVQVTIDDRVGHRADIYRRS